MQDSNQPNFQLGESLDASLSDLKAAWAERGGTERLLSKDASLFSGADEARWMGWLQPSSDVLGLTAFSESLASGALADTETVFLLGMGGSSLGSEVVYRTLAQEATRRLVVLDTTNAEAVGSALDTAEPAKSIVIAASKSGSTLETAALLELFFARFERTLGSGAASRFVAITDPGSAFEKRARADNFGHVFLGDPEIGGRFSVLSPFGLVPAVAMGLDSVRLVERAKGELAALSGAASHSSAIDLGLALAACCAEGRNKVTLVASPGLRSFGTWLEQLLAESTGKHGLGLVPVDGEPLRESTPMGADRVLVQVSIAGEKPAVAVECWPDVPKIEIELSEAYDLGGEFYRWQIATAVVGAELKLNPFDQPDVESAKIATRKLVSELDPSQPLTMATAPAVAVAGDQSPAQVLRSLLADDGEPGTYFTVLAYLPMSPNTQQALSELRAEVLEARGWATCLGFGPRYLHSTGQVHKGGPPQGRFLVLTAATDDSRLIPGMNQRLSEVHRAQALGDFQVLLERGRPVAHFELRGPLEVALDELKSALQSAL